MQEPREMSLAAKTLPRAVVPPPNHQGSRGRTRGMGTPERRSHMGPGRWRRNERPLGRTARTRRLVCLDWRPLGAWKGCPTYHPDCLTGKRKWRIAPAYLVGRDKLRVFAKLRGRRLVAICPFEGILGRLGGTLFQQEVSGGNGEEKVSRSKLARPAVGKNGVREE